MNRIRTFGLAKTWLLFCAMLAIFSDFIANERPIRLNFQGKSYHPALDALMRPNQMPYPVAGLENIRLTRTWYLLAEQDVFRAPIPFSPGKFWQDQPGILLPPGSAHPGRSSPYLHLLGTDERGRDVAAAFVQGARISVLTGLWATLLSAGIGLLIGTFAGYFGDKRLYIPRYVLWFSFLSLPLAYFYGFIARAWPLRQSLDNTEIIKSLGIFFAVLSVFTGSGYLLSRKVAYFARKILIPADLLLMRFAEIVNAVPRLLLIIAMAVLWQGRGSSFWMIVSMIGLFGWTHIARFARSELLKVRELDYVMAARGLGLSNWAILWKHALPNIMGPIKVALITGFSGAIMLEASISFLGYGDLDMDGATWGSLLNSYRDNRQCWWLLMVPFVGICATLLSLNQVAKGEEG